MQSQTISIMLGKGSISHNSRKFIADNVDPARTPNNIEFANQDIKQAYHDLFDDALTKYNAKQTRKDRVIPDYYEKIRTGKQEKTFYEIIVQIGNKDTMNAKSPNGELAKTILTEYMYDFVDRNKNLYVFSAHLHMDEETPHLHIDFIPYTTGSKRGLETRVSLKKAMEQLGFVGKGRQETEFNLWVESEKKQLEQAMISHDIQWNQLGTHNEHLSVYDYKKQERIKEVKALEDKVEMLEKRLKDVEEDTADIDSLTHDLTDDLWVIPDPKRFMTATNYKNEYVIPFIQKLKKVVNHIIKDYLRLKHEVKSLRSKILPLKMKINEQDEIIDRLIAENRDDSLKLKKLQKVLGYKTFDELLNTPKEKNKNVREKDYR